jgi:hypothetical protein
MTVRVEPYTLDWKARAIAEPMPAMPEPPVAADGTQIATDGFEQLTSGANKLKGYLEAGEREAKRLSESFTAAAEAYRQVDVETATALANGETAPQIAPVTPRPILSDPVPVPSDFAGLNSDPVATYANVEQVAEQLEQPDQAASLTHYADNLKLYAHDLIVHADNFKDSGLSWSGPAADNAMAALDKHRAWLLQMVDTTRDLADRAQELADAHSIAKSNHPTTAQIKQLMQEMQAYGFNPQAMAAYQALQTKSDEVQTAYANGAKMPVCHPPKPPSGSPSLPPVTGNGDPRDSDIRKMKDPGQNGPGGNPPGGSPPAGGTPESPQTPTTPTAPTSPASAEQPKSGGQPSSGGSPSGGSPGGSPSGGSGSGGGMPSLPGGDPSKDVPTLPDPNLVPASADAGSGGGSGGGGSGGGGAGAMPLQPAASGPALGTSPAAGGMAGHPAAASAGGGMAGGMGGGGMPMGGHGQGGGGKEKRRTPGLTPDEVIYTEDREWTEAYIGQQAKRRTPADSKDAK